MEAASAAMTPQRAVVPQAEPVPVPGPILHSDAAALPGKLLQFPSTAVEQRPAVSRRVYLLGEFILLFVGLPLTLFFHFAMSWPRIPVLWAGTVFCAVMLWRDPTFDRRQLWNFSGAASQIGQILALFGTGVVVIGALVWTYAPSLFLIFPRTHPVFWLFVMVTYPVFSVFPQGLVYRAYLLHRYRPLLQPDSAAPPGLLIFASAAVFALMHVVFHNWIAIALTFPGGVLFARHYLNSKSLFTSTLEHALYGCFLFTIGLGQFFYLLPL